MTAGSFKHKLWMLAEHADFYDWRPRWLWRWLLRRLDRSNGYEFDYDA